MSFVELLCLGPYVCMCIYLYDYIQERVRRGERKNRDAFRKLLEEHVAAGILNAKTQWREYCLKVVHIFIACDEKLE